VFLLQNLIFKGEERNSVLLANIRLVQPEKNGARHNTSILAKVISEEEQVKKTLFIYDAARVECSYLARFTT